MRSGTAKYFAADSAIRLTILLFTLGALPALAQTNPINVTLIDYWKHEPQDLFVTQLMAKVAAKQVKLNSTNQETLTRSLLTALDIPVSSQMLVFSGTASQGSRVNIRNPRALYFNDEVYIGMVPGGFVEMIGFDPEFGGVFYSFEKMNAGSAPVPERPQDCMRCHATVASGFLPCMIARSIIPNINGGRSPKAFGRVIAGHQIPFQERFGGWHVTSVKPLPACKEGLIEIQKPEGLVVEHIKAGEKYDGNMHLVTSSDILAHLLHEHQMGFVNRVIRYRATASRELSADGSYTNLAKAQLEIRERELVKYLFFADEAALPTGGISGSPLYIKDFTANRKPNKMGAALKDLDLTSRMFKYRCSYMIYTSLWKQMPIALSSRLYARMKTALSGADSDFAYLPADERRNIVLILRDTLPDLPADWH